MNIRKTLCGVAALAAATASLSAQSLSLGLNFASTDPDAATSSLAPEEIAGVVPQANWNNLTGASGTVATGLNYDSSGAPAASGVSVTWSSPNTWRSGANNGFAAGSADRKLLSGYLDSNDTAAGGVNISVTGLDPAMAAAGYDVYVYFVSDSNANRGGAYTLTAANGPVVKYGSTLGTPATYIEDPGNDINLSADGTHLRFVGNFGTSFTLTSDTTLTTPNGFRAPVNAIQIVPTPQFGPEFSQQPRSSTVYSGRNVRFTAAANGFPTITGYRWERDGVALTESARIVGVNTTTLTINNATAADVGDYRLVAVSSRGETPSNVARLDIATPDGSQYEAGIITAAPGAYWRLNDNIESLFAADYVGGLVGLYTEATTHGEFTPGPISPQFPGFTAGNTAALFLGGSGATQVTVPTPALNANTATFVAWINPAAQQLDFTGIFMTRETTQAGLGFGAGGQLGYTWNNNNANTYSWNSGLIPTVGEWNMVALVVEANKATMFLGSGGTLRAAINAIPHTAEVWGGNAMIGNDAGANRGFNGVIDEVAMFTRALSFAEVANLYERATGIPQVLPPTISPQPRAQALYAGATVTFRSAAAGTGITTRWTRDGQTLADSERITGATTDTLTIRNITAADAATYRFVAQNSAGTSESDPAVLTVLTPENQYVSDVIGLNPLSYWRLNETGDPLSGTLVARDSWGGRDGTWGTASLPGSEGPSPATGYGTFEAANTGNRSRFNTANSWVNVPPPGITTDTMTFLAWINPVSRVGNAGIIYARGGQPATGMNLGGAGNLGYAWRDVAATYNFNSGLTPPLNQWSMVAVVVEPTQATLHMFNANGASSAVNVTPHAARAFTDTSMRIGGDQNNNNRTFDGRIDEAVIFNSALTGEQLQALYNRAIGVTQPVIVSQPVAVNDYIGSTVVLSSAASGTAPIAYRWERFSGGNWVAVTDDGNITGATTGTLRIANANAAMSGDYRLVATNAQGQAISEVAALNFTAPPAGAAAVLGLDPLLYYRFNEVGSPSPGPLRAYDYSGFQRHGTYGVASLTEQEGPRPPAFPIWEETNIGFAPVLNTANSWVTGAPLTTVAANTVNTLSVVAWIKPNTLVASSGIVFWRAGQPATGLNLTGAGALGYHWRDAAATYNFASGITPPLSEWSMVAVVVEPTQATLYMVNPNGTSTAVNTTAHAVRTFTDAVRIGGDPNNTNRTFDGAIDEVSVYGTALTAAQIADLYNGRVPQTAPEIRISQSGGQITLSWDGPGSVVSTPTLDPGAQWSPEPAIQNGVPFTNPGGLSRFYRVVR